MRIVIGAAVLALAIGLAGCNESTSARAHPTITPLPSGHDSALAGTDLEFVPRVLVQQPDGRIAVPGTVVTFTASSGGSVAGTPALTDPQGMAGPAAWRLGNTVGMQTLIAATADGATAAITAVALPRAQDGVFASIVVGRQHACALNPGGAAFCWGQNANGQLGDGTSTSRNSPVAVVGGLRFQKLVAGYEHSCGLAAGGALYCWGGNAAGGLGDGTTTPRFLPVPSAGGLRFIDIAAGDGHTCGIATDGVTYCWGQNFAQLGSGSAESSALPVAVKGGHHFRAIAAWQWLTCATDDGGRPYCWGRRSETGFSAFRSDTARLISGVSGLQSIAVGDNHACGMTTDGQTWCWSWVAAAAAAPNAGPALRQIAVGLIACGVASTDGAIECWDAGFAFDTPPRPIASGLSVASVAAGGFQCALTALRAPYCWGANDAGGLGTGASTASRFPVAVNAP
jgi:hypothetical protein